MRGIGPLSSCFTIVVFYHKWTRKSNIKFLFLFFSFVCFVFGKFFILFFNFGIPRNESVPCIDAMDMLLC